ncbi:MAG: hypothetical protein JWQ04_2706, partial [Pedosphaera sp.]|nr:hypothetical protein [Pedosphaera sp.]
MAVFILRSSNEGVAQTTNLSKALENGGAIFGIPAMTTPDGKLTHEAHRFTTEAYEREAFRLVIQEANQVAKALQLPEKIPITESDLTQGYILGYGMTFMHGRPIGNVHTRDYGYFVSVDKKLSFVEGAHQATDCFKWMEQYQWPKDRINTNEAYQLAAKWLVAASMDLDGLNRDCKLVINPEKYYNPSSITEKGKFVPIYELYWQSPQNVADGFGNVAAV